MFPFQDYRVVEVSVDNPGLSGQVLTTVNKRSYVSYEIYSSESIGFGGGNSISGVYFQPNVFRQFLALYEVDAGEALIATTAGSAVVEAGLDIVAVQDLNTASYLLRGRLHIFELPDAV